VGVFASSAIALSPQLRWRTCCHNPSKVISLFQRRTPGGVTSGGGGHVEPLPGPEELARLGEAVVAGDTPALRLVGLCRTFGDRTVVDHVSLTVPRGSFFGL